MRFRSRPFNFTLPILVFLPTCLLADQIRLDYPADPRHVVLSYTMMHDQIADADPIPLLRIYGDGRVHVHYPFYMQKAGDYQLFLSPAEVRSLLASMEAAGVLEFDPVQIQAKRDAVINARKTATGEVFEFSDASYTVIEVSLSRYHQGPKSIENFSHKAVWPNLAQEALLFPQLAELAKVAEAEVHLRALLESKALVEVR